ELLPGKNTLVWKFVSGLQRPGHGTYVDEEKVDKLICVRPLKPGKSHSRICTTETLEVETNSRLDSVLLLSSVNLPGGELKMSSPMREYLQEGDLISKDRLCFSDGALSRHTRSLKYGKSHFFSLCLSWVRGGKDTFHNLPCGHPSSLANNGFVWLYPTPGQQEKLGLYTSLDLSDREVISRLRNCLLALAAHKVLLMTPVFFTVKDILKPEVMEEIVMLTQQKLLEQEG
uniref:RRP4 S1 domain-containing protein n=1 Tax=Sphaeramia orbicularis TaxID=375764 RepID=A0A672YII9_9TELE